MLLLAANHQGISRCAARDRLRKLIKVDKDESLSIRFLVEVAVHLGDASKLRRIEGAHVECVLTVRNSDGHLGAKQLACIILVDQPARVLVEETSRGLHR